MPITSKLLQFPEFDKNTYYSWYAYLKMANFLLQDGGLNSKFYWSKLVNFFVYYHAEDKYEVLNG